MAIKPWKPIDQPKTIAQGFRKRLDLQHFVDHAGKEQEFYFLEGVTWSVVLPLTRSGDVVLVRQYKMGRESITEELPGGSAQYAGEDAFSTMRRELLEETGYVSQRIIALGKAWMDSCSSHTVCHLFLALDCVPEHSYVPDQHEQIEVVAVPFQTFARDILSGGYEYQKEAALLFMRAFSHLPFAYRLIVFWEVLKRVFTV